MPLDVIISISLLLFVTAFVTLIGMFYLLFRLDKIKHPERHIFIPARFIPIRRERPHKYIMNNFTKQIFFGNHHHNSRIKIVNRNSVLETDKYSFK